MVFQPATALTTLPTARGIQDPRTVPSRGFPPHPPLQTLLHTLGALVSLSQKAVRLEIGVYPVTGASQALEECLGHDGYINKYLLGECMVHQEPQISG